MPTPTEVLTGLANELSAAVADLVDAAHEQQANTGAIAQALADMLEIARARVDKQPQVTVQVNPTPVHVNVDSMCDCTVHHEYDGAGRLVKSHLKRIPKGT